MTLAIHNLETFITSFILTQRQCADAEGLSLVDYLLIYPKLENKFAPEDLNNISSLKHVCDLRKFHPEREVK